jgi:two-component system sensor histidine kinase/response regulator
MPLHAPLNALGARQPEILVVEDEQIVALELQNRLTKMGYQVTELAATGERALQSIEEHRPDLVLMDIVLAGKMTGTQTAQRVHEQFDIPVVYLTAYSDPATIEQVKETGGHGFLTKPLQPQELHAVIQLALARHDKEQHRRDTERSAWQEICDESQTQLQQFTTAAGHDLQEPLRTATCFIDLLARRARPKLDGEELELLGQARAGLSRMNTLLQDLLAYARAGLPEGAPLPSTPAKAALGWAISNLQGAMAESGATITHDVLPAVQAEPSQLAQVFQNLLSNAIKYRRSTCPPRIHVGFESRGGESLFWVKDNGIGFDPQDAERIFTPFQRLHSQQEYAGTGIGLAICKKIIEAHGGRIWAESGQGQGATFLFTLPDRA